MEDVDRVLYASSAGKKMSLFLFPGEISLFFPLSRSFSLPLENVASLSSPSLCIIMTAVTVTVIVTVVIAGRLCVCEDFFWGLPAKCHMIPLFGRGNVFRKGCWFRIYSDLLLMSKARV